MIFFCLDREAAGYESVTRTCMMMSDKKAKNISSIEYGTAN